MNHKDFTEVKYVSAESPQDALWGCPEFSSARLARKFLADQLKVSGNLYARDRIYRVTTIVQIEPEAVIAYDLIDRETECSDDSRP